LSWKKPRTVFVNSMSDLFHEDVPDEFIDRVFAVMALCPQHTFIVLTKRPERMLAWNRDIGGTTRRDWVFAAAGFLLNLSRLRFPDWPLSNVWLGVSVEDQATAALRIPLLLQTPAAVRVVSAEPLLGPVDLTNLNLLGHSLDALLGEWCAKSTTCLVSDKGDGAIDWLIVGGESGPKARPCDVAWIRSLVQQAKAAGTACFVKQLGANVTDRNDAGFEGDTPGGWPMDTSVEDVDLSRHWQGDPVRVRLRDHKGGDPSEWAEDLRVREWPAVSTCNRSDA
jgi:protein gp37